MNILESSRTGNYKLVEPISQDAGSTLYLAEDNEQQTVFLEIYGAAKAETAVSRLRTIQNIPAFSLIDVGVTSDEIPFAIIPFSPGTLLSDLLHDNPAAFTPNEAITLIQQLTTAIEHAQNEAVSHAGLRPEKIWITESRQPIILGWGESAPTETTAAADPSQIDYIAPEYRAESIPTAQTNIYALGVLLYTLLANHPPYISSTAEWDIFSNANESQMEPLEKARPGLPSSFYQLVRNCLWSQPWNRYDSLSDFGAALNTIPGATKKTVSSLSAAPRRTNGRFLTPPLLYATIGIIAVALLGSLFFIFRGSGGTETDAAEATQPPLPVLIDAVETTTQTAVPTETTAPTNTAVPT
ncbi:MAG: protein kinase, partial [Anaerolineales bacterium]|nr:protein kinase [Anaerolineales bacterium]